MSNSGNSSWRPIRRKLRGYTKGYDCEPRWDEVGLARDCHDCSVCVQVTELECVSSQTTAIKSQKTELNLTIEELEAALKTKEEVRREANEEKRSFYPNIIFVFRNYICSKLKWRVPTSSRLRKTR